MGRSVKKGPFVDDQPYLARPFTQEQRARAEALAARGGVPALETSYPISFVGTGRTLNEATENGLARAACAPGASANRAERAGRTGPNRQMSAQENMTPSLPPSQPISKSL
ncbi:hypothetical protein AB1399_00005, partial [Hydrogenibacillus schlegelii]